MSALDDAVREIQERTLAMTDGAPRHGLFVGVEGEPEELMRQVLSGYVPLPDTDTALEYLEAGTISLCVVVNHASTEKELRVGVGLLAAQFLAVGVACARREADDEEGSA